MNGECLAIYRVLWKGRATSREADMGSSRRLVEGFLITEVPSLGAVTVCGDVEME
jgi:hypothetical protein